MTRLRRVHLPAILFIAVVSALLIFVASHDAVAVPTFGPQSEACLDDALTGAECDGSGGGGAADDISTKFCVGDTLSGPCANGNEKDSNFGFVTTFTPPEFFVAKGGDIPDGAIVGQLKSSATLGLLNFPCSSSIAVAFTLMDGSIDNSAGNLMDPKAPGEADLLENFALDSNNNGIADGAEKYPSFLNTLFDPDYDGPGPDGLPRTGDDVNGSTPPLVPRARLFGASFVQGNWVTINFMVFDPGTLITDELPPSDFDPSLGYLSVTVLQDPSAPATQGPISDFCAPLDVSTFTFANTRDNPCTPAPGPTGCPGSPRLGCENNIDDDGDTKVNDGCPASGTPETGAECDNDKDDPAELEDAIINDGCPQVGDVNEGFVPDPDGCDGDNQEASCKYRRNPNTKGTYTVSVLALSQRDADGDGIENSLDVCWDIPNPNWDPRAVDIANDGDGGIGDGLPNECDPDNNVQSNASPQICPEGNTGPDEDQDCLSNRQDNCPLIPNFPPTDEDSDGVGDACDPNLDDADAQGVFVKVVLASSVEIISTVTGDGGGDDGGGGDGGGGGDTDVAGTTGGPTGSGVGGPDTGVGSLAPAISSIPAWAAIASGLGGAGLLGSLGALAARITGLRRRSDD